MINIYYQDKTGAGFDLTPAIKSARWATKLSGVPASLEAEVLDCGVAFEHGGAITAYEDGRGFFLGYLFGYSRCEPGIISLTAYDQTRYLKNKDTYVFTARRADQITAKIAADFKLIIGTLENTGYVIPSLIEDDCCLFDIILRCLELTHDNTGELFYLWDDFGELRLSRAGGEPVADNALTAGYSYTSDIDSKTYNTIKLYRENSSGGKRDVYVFQDDENTRRWGILQDSRRLEQEQNAGQIKLLGNQLLELYNRPEETLELTALSDLSVRAGMTLRAVIGDIGINGDFLIEETEQELGGGKMKIKLRMGTH